MLVKLSYKEKGHLKYLRHKEYYIRKARNWQKNNAERDLTNHRKWQQNNRDICAEYSREFYHLHREEQLARLAAYKYPMNKNCEVCGATEKLERHHPNYSKPYYFETLCKRCHEKKHKNFPLIDSSIRWLKITPKPLNMHELHTL